jgi:hypothetical protein
MPTSLAEGQDGWARSRTNERGRRAVIAGLSSEAARRESTCRLRAWPGSPWLLRSALWSCLEACSAGAATVRARWRSPACSPVSGGAVRWIRAVQHAAQNLIGMLSDRVFGTDLPPEGRLQPVPGDPNEPRRGAPGTPRSRAGNSSTPPRWHIASGRGAAGWPGERGCDDRAHARHRRAPCA